VRKKKTMRQRKALMKELGFFYPGQVCFIYKHVLMGLWNGKAQSILLGFYSTNSTEESTYQGKRCVQKKERREQGIRKYRSRSTSSPRLRLGGLRHKKGRNPLQRQIKSTNDARRNIRNRFIYFLEPIPENFGYSLGGYSHRERYRAPDRKKSTKERRRVEAGNKEKIDRHEVQT
jgi:hypothetical protein